MAVVSINNSPIRSILDTTITIPVAASFPRTPRINSESNRPAVARWPPRRPSSGRAAPASCAGRPQSWCTAASAAVGPCGRRRLSPAAGWRSAPAARPPRRRTGGPHSRAGTGWAPSGRPLRWRRCERRRADGAWCADGLCVGQHRAECLWAGGGGVPGLFGMCAFVC